MRLGVNLGPTGDWPAMLAAAQTAEQLGFDAVGFLDHYHTDNLEWPYHCGWSAYGALALATSRIHLVPLVIDRLNYLPGVLAKETATLAIISGGRFEFGIGAGDYFQEARAWGLTVPAAAARIAGLKEIVTALRLIWSGSKVTFEGEHMHLKDAAATPAPTPPPRVMVGAGRSRTLDSQCCGLCRRDSTFTPTMISSVLRASRSTPGSAPSRSLGLRLGLAERSCLKSWLPGKTWASAARFSPSGIPSTS